MLIPNLSGRLCRIAIERMEAGAEEEAGARTSEASNLLQVLEEHMHSTGVRFTDVFFLLDRRACVRKRELASKNTINRGH